MVSTPTLASSSPAAGLRGRRPFVRVLLAATSLLAVVGFALYAAYLASRASEIDEPVPIAVPSKGATTPVGTGTIAPDFTLAALEGSPVRLSDFAGRPVWINVWASWCAPCRAEMPDINQVYQEQRTKDSGSAGLALLAVSLGEEPPAARRYLQTTKYDLPVLVDPAFAFTEHYRITGLPTHFFIGRDGVIKDFAIGGLKPNAMRSRLAKIL